MRPRSYISTHARTRTQRVKGTLDPVFPDETFAFCVHDDVRAVGFLLLAIFDSQLLGDDVFLGEVRLPLRDLLPDTPVDVWLPLHPRHPRDPVSGELHLLADLVPRDQAKTAPPPWAAIGPGPAADAAASGPSAEAPVHTHAGVVTVADTLLHSQVAPGGGPAAPHDPGHASCVVSIIVLAAKNLVPDDRRRPIEPYVKVRAPHRRGWGGGGDTGERFRPDPRAPSRRLASCGWARKTRSARGPSATSRVSPGRSGGTAS